MTDLCGLRWADVQRNHAEKNYLDHSDWLSQGQELGGTSAPGTFRPLRCALEGGLALLLEYSVRSGVRAWVNICPKSFSTKATVPESTVSTLLL